MSDAVGNVMECVRCGKLSPPGEGWDSAPGWGCLYGCLAVCSLKCAEEFARHESRYGRLREGDVVFQPPADPSRREE